MVSKKFKPRDRVYYTSGDERTYGIVGSQDEVAREDQHCTDTPTNSPRVWARWGGCSELTYVKESDVFVANEVDVYALEDRPAFPVHGLMDTKSGGRYGVSEPGMTLRQYAMVAIVQGLISRGGSSWKPEELAKSAAEHADALIEKMKEPHG